MNKLTEPHLWDSSFGLIFLLHPLFKHAPIKTSITVCQHDRTISTILNFFTDTEHNLRLDLNALIEQSLTLIEQPEISACAHNFDRNN